MEVLDKLAMLTEVDEAPVASFAKTIIRYKGLLESGKISNDEYIALLNSIRASLVITAQATNIENRVALANVIDTLLAIGRSIISI